MAHADRAAQHFFARQHGLITRRQALDLGLTRHQIQYRLDRELWRSIDTGVYLNTAVPPTSATRLLAVCLGTGAVVSHRSAGRLWALDGVRPGRPEVTVEAHRGLVRRHVRVHETTQWDRIDQHAIDGLPVTGIGRTLLDLGAVLPMAGLRQAVDDARRRNLVDWPELARVYLRHARRGRDGSGSLRRLLEAHVGELVVPRSDWSRRVADLLVAAGLPRPRFEYRVSDGHGFVAELDLAFPDVGLGLELDSVAWHLDRVSFERDARRRNRLENLGWSIRNFTWSDYADHPDRLIGTVVDAYSLLRSRLAS
jgi:hypothetical protein